MDKTELINRFDFHPAVDQDTQDRHDAVRASCLELASHLDFLLPDGREKSLAITNLEETMMWANAGVARSAAKVRAAAAAGEPDAPPRDAAAHRPAP